MSVHGKIHLTVADTCSVGEASHTKKGDGNALEQYIKVDLGAVGSADRCGHRLVKKYLSLFILFSPRKVRIFH